MTTAKVISTRIFQVQVYAWVLLAATWLCIAQQANGSKVASEDAESTVVKNTAELCNTLQSIDFSSVPDAPFQITTARAVDASRNQPGYCHIEGYVPPSFGFLMRLPTSDRWNGKFLQLGCSGLCGPDYIQARIFRCDDPLRRGYACIIADGGHIGGGDAKWAQNNPYALIDYAALAPHLAALAGKAIVQSYYHKSPSKSYFTGCSAGGLQALWEAQKFPWDFDGIIAGSPTIRGSDYAIALFWGRRAFTGPDGEPLLVQKDLHVLHRAVLDQCDMNDGIKDGLIGNPRMCRFSPVQLRCRSENKDACLTDSQITAVEEIYRGPVAASGEQIAPPIAMKGSELNWIRVFSPTNSDALALARNYADWVRYYLFQPNPGLAWKLDDFDFERDYKRLGIAQIGEPVNPDLRRFKAAGGKLILFTNWNDEIGGALAAVDYYEVAERVHGGGAATEHFMRLFAIPGTDHCHRTGLDGSFTAVDYLSYLESWVEKGLVPDKVIGLHVKSGTSAESIATEYPIDPARVDYTRPFYPYPIEAQYLGHGDPNSASNFGPLVQRRSDSALGNGQR